MDFIPSQYNPANAAQIDGSGNLIPGTGQFYTSAGNGLVICGQGGLPIGCVYPDRFTWQPRFGFAFDPTGNGKTSIRGGFGVYHDLNAIQEVSSEQNTGGPPAVLSPAAYNIVGYQSIVPGPTPVTTATAYATRAAIPMVMQYNMTVQHEFSGNNFLSVGWVGTLGVIWEPSVTSIKSPMVLPRGMRRLWRMELGRLIATRRQLRRTEYPDPRA